MSQHKRDLYMFIAACLTIILVALIGAVMEAKSSYGAVPGSM